MRSGRTKTLMKISRERQLALPDATGSVALVQGGKLNSGQNRDSRNRPTHAHRWDTSSQGDRNKFFKK